MNKLTSFILPALTLLTVVGLIIGGYFYLGENNSKRLISQVKLVVLEKRETPIISQEDKTTLAPSSDAQVMITKDGFIPSTLTIAQGQALTWVNEDRSSHTIASLPKTAFNNLPDLDSGSLQPSDSYTFTFEKTGTFSYANSNTSKFKGVVIVK